MLLLNLTPDPTAHLPLHMYPGRLCHLALEEHPAGRGLQFVGAARARHDGITATRGGSDCEDDFKAGGGSLCPLASVGGAGRV